MTYLTTLLVAEMYLLFIYFTKLPVAERYKAYSMTISEYRFWKNVKESALS